MVGGQAPLPLMAAYSPGHVTETWGSSASNNPPSEVDDDDVVLLRFTHNCKLYTGGKARKTPNL